MGRYIPDEIANAPMPSYLQQQAPVQQVNPAEAMINAERAQQRQMIQDQENDQGWWGRFWNGGMEKVDTFYKNWESDLVAGIDATASMATGNKTLSMEDTYKVSPGQALEANIQSLWDPNVKLAESQWRESKWGASNRNPLDDDFSVNLVSGSLDFAVDWFLDPLVLVGKGAKVLRFGTAFGKPLIKGGGLTHRLTSGKAGASVVKQVGDDIDAAIASPEFSRGTVGKINKMARDLANNDYNYALKLKEFQGPNQGALATAAAMIQDERTMKVFLGAMSGSQRHIDELSRIRNDLYTNFVKLGNPGLYERLAVHTPEHKMPVVLENFLEPGADIARRLDDMAKNNAPFANLLDEMGYNSTLRGVEAAGRLAGEAGGSPLIRDWRGRSRTMFAIRSARTQAKLAKKRNQGTGSAAWEYIYKDGFGVPTRVWSSTKNFFTGKEANGYVATRGPEAGRGFVEIEAAITDAPRLRLDQEFQLQAMELWGRAVTPDQKFTAVRQIENLAFQRLVRGYLNGSDLGRQLASMEAKDQKAALKALDDLRDEMYSLIDKRRADLVTAARNDKRAYATMIDPEDGTQIVMDARLRSQLATSEPMLDMKILQKTANILVKEFGKQYDRFGKVKSENLVTAARKVSPVEPTSTLRRQSAVNILDTGLSLWKAAVLIRLGYTQRNLVENWLRSFATIGLLPMVSRIPGGIARSGVNTTKRTGRYLFDKSYKVGDYRFRKNTWQKLASDEAEKIANLKARIEAGEFNLDDQLRAAEDALEKYTRRSEWANRTLHTGDPIPWFGGGKGIEVAGRSFSAFDDPVMRELTSMSQTNRNVLEALSNGEADLALSARNYVLINPGEPQYWDELLQSGFQFQNDEVARRLLNGDDPLSVADWMKSREARYYRDDMKTPIRGVDEYVSQMNELVTRYLPTERSRQMVREGTSAAELKAELGALFDTNGLSPIHGREVMRTANAHDKSILRRMTDRVFYVLGDLPESHLARQPFYDTVWRKEFNARVAIAKSEGRELTDDVLEGINRAAKQQALRDLKDTLYTIEHYSTMAKYLRFVIPFFPAFENSFQAWAKIVARDPAVIPRADILWNIPNTFGMVVDENGEVVPHDRYGFALGGDRNNWVIMPSVMRDWTIEKTGLPMDIPQASFNVVFPGETPYLPGFGPLVGVPANFMLKNKPEWQETIKSLPLGETIFNQIIPFGRTNSEDWQLLVPAGWRKMVQLAGQEGNDMWLGISGAVMRDRHMQWLEEGGRAEDRWTPQEVIDKTNAYFALSIAASYLGPVSVSPGSKYDLIVNHWRQLSEDPSLTYDARIRRLEQKFGPNAAVMITSTSESVPGVANTMGEYDVQKANPELARQLATRGVEFVGMLGAGVPAGQFNQGVYTAMGMQNVPGTSTPYRRKKSLSEMETDLDMGQAWREYRQAKDARDEALAQMGVSINANAAVGIKYAWDQFKNVYMVNKYGDSWATQINTWSQNDGVNLLAVQDILSDEKFMKENGDDPVWVQVSQYMAARRSAREAIAAGADSATVKELWGQYREQVRYSSLAFSDFFDFYLEGDEDLQEYAGVQ